MTTNCADDTALTTELLAVHEAIAAVLADLPAIAKNGQAPGNMGGYAFRRVEDITAALKPLFAKHGVLCLPNVMNRIESQRPTAKGGVMFCVDLEICFRFVGPQGDELAANVWGQGTDSGDKATQKAVTSAFKTMLSVVFCISDSESDAEAHDVPETVQPARPAPAAPDRVEAFVAAVTENDLTEWVKEQGFAWPWTDLACDMIADKVASLPLPSSIAGTPDADGEPVMGRAESLAREAERNASSTPDLSEYSSDPF